jgi:tRNA threonylcarbamoyladenosine biosynthesis protein TsaB
MIVLGFDTATPSTAVGLRLSDGRTLQARDDPGARDHPGHATRLLPMAHELLATAGLGWSAIDRIAVGTGPGTFTGLRVGIATARGLAQGLAAELVGVSSLQALALSALTAAAEPQAEALDGVLAVIDARRGEAFVAAYGRRDGETAPAELVPARALAPENLGVVLDEAAGPGAGDHWVAVGDGALRFRRYLERRGVVVPDGASPLHLVSAEALCELALHQPAALPGEQVLPDYLRRPDAELALDAASAGAGNG